MRKTDYQKKLFFSEGGLWVAWYGAVFFPLPQSTRGTTIPLPRVTAPNPAAADSHLLHSSRFNHTPFERQRRGTVHGRAGRMYAWNTSRAVEIPTSYGECAYCCPLSGQYTSNSGRSLDDTDSSWISGDAKTPGNSLVEAFL